MLNYGINDIFRNKMYKYDEKQIILFLDKLENIEQDIYLKIMLMDGYQVLNKRRNYIKDDKLSIRLYNILSRTNYEHIKSILEDNYILLQTLFVNAKGFYQMPFVDRCLLIEENNHKDKLIFQNNFYLIDSCVYSLGKDMTSINYYYNDYLNKLGNKYIHNFYELVLVIMSKLKNEDLNLYNKNFLEILKDFYIGNKFLQSIDENIVLETQEYSDLLEQKEVFDITELLEDTPENFLKVLSVALEYHNSMSKTKEEEEFIDNNISSKMIKKLNINKEK